MPKQVEYAVYKGDELFVIGTKEECAQHIGVKPETIYWHATPTGKKRLASRKRPERCLCIDKVS